MTSLFSASYESNELGMRLSQKDALDGTGYELSVADDVEIAPGATVGSADSEHIELVAKKYVE